MGVGVVPAGYLTHVASDPSVSSWCDCKLQVCFCVCVLMKAKSVKWTVFADGALEEKLRAVRVTERDTFPLKHRGQPTI